MADPDPRPKQEREMALRRLMQITHELGLYDDCDECRRTGGHDW